MDDNTPKPKIEYSEFKRILEAQRAANKTAEAIETSSKKLNDLTEEIRDEDKKVVGEQEKSDKELNANIKELVKITRESAKDIAKVIADKQPKSFGDNLKSKFDSKFGSVRNILDTMGIVKKGTGGMLDSALNRREADKTFIKGDMKLHGSSEQEARNKLQTIKDHEKIVSKNEKEISKFTKLGISEEQLGKTANGKKLLDTRRTNVQEISKLDYRVQPQVEEAKKEKNKAPMSAKNKTPMGTTPVSAVLANTNNPQLEEAKKEKNKAPMSAKNKAPMGTSPISAIVGNSDNPKIQTDELQQEAIKREDDQTELLKRIAENTGGKDKFKAEKKDDLGDSLGPLGIGLAVAAGTIAGLVSAWVKTVKLFGEMFGKGLTALGEIFPSFGKILKVVQETFTGFIEGIKGIFSSVVSKFASMFESAVGFFKNLFGEGSLLGKVVSTIKSAVTGFLEPITAGFTALAEASGPISKAISFVKNGIGTFMEFFTGIGSKLEMFGTLFRAVSGIVSKIAYPLMVVMAVWDTIKGALKGWEEGGLIGAIGGAIKGLFNSLVGGVADMIKGAISWIAGALGFTAVEKFLDSFSFEDLFSDLVDAILFIPQTIQNFIMHPIDSIMKLGKIIMDTFSGIVHVFDPVIDFFSGIGDSIIGMLEGIGIPEMGFTIPIIGKKVSIGPFYPFKKDSEAPADTPSTDAAGGTTKAVPPENDNPVSGQPAATGAAPAATGAAPAATGAAPAAGTTSTVTTKIAGEDVVPGQPLSAKQMAVIGMSTSMGNKYPAEIMDQYNKQLGRKSETAAGDAASPIVEKSATAAGDAASPIVEKSATPIPGGGQTVDPSAQNYNATAAGTQPNAPGKATPITEGGKKPPPNALSAMIAGGAKLFGVDLEAAQGAPAPAGTGNAIEAKTGDVANSRDDLSSKGGGTSVVNAPTTVNNNSQTSSHAKSPFRNEEGTLNKYYASRLGAY